MNSPILSVINNKHFRNLWLGQITSQVATNMLTFVLVLRIYQTTVSNTAVSLLILTLGLPAVVVGILAGTLVDSWDKRNVLIVTNLLRTILILGFFFSSETPLWVYLLILAISITTQFFVPAEAPTIPRLVSKELLLPANSLFTFTFYTSMVVGYIFSGPALRFFGNHNVFLFLSALLALAAFFVSQIPNEVKKAQAKMKFDKDEAVKIYRDFLSGLKFIKEDKKVGLAIFLQTVAQALFVCLATLAPGFADTVLKIEVSDASYIILGPAGTGLILGALLVGQFGQRFPKERLVNIGIVCAGVLLFLLAILAGGLGGLVVALLLLGLLGVFTAFVTVPSSTMLQEYTPSALQGRVYGFVTAFVGGAAILPAIFTGLAADLFGIRAVILFLALLVLAFAIYRLNKARYNVL